MMDPVGDAIKKLRRYALARVESDTKDPRGRFTRAFAVAIALVLVASTVAPVLAIGAVDAAGPPDGMVGVPSENVASDLPPQTPMGEAAEDLAAAGVMASDHSGTLDVVVTSPGRAKSKYTGGTLHGDGPIALVFRDTEVSAGREVAIPADALEDVLGKKPTAAFGTHTEGGEDTGEWAREIRYENGYAIIPIAEFSTNSITFSGGVSISAQNANDGSTFTYSVANDSTVDQYGINLTGRRVTANTSRSGILATGESFTVSPGGTTTPENRTLTMEGSRKTVNQTAHITDGTNTTITVDGNVAPRNESVELVGQYSETAQSVSGSTVNRSATESVAAGSLDPSSESISLSDIPRQNNTIYPVNGLDVYQSSIGSITRQTGVTAISAIEMYAWTYTSGTDPTIEIIIDGQSFGNVTANGGSQTFEYSRADPVIVDGDTTIDINAYDKSDYFEFEWLDNQGAYMDFIEPSTTSVTVGHANGTTTIGPNGSGAIDLTPGSNSVSVDTDYGEVDYSLSYTERNGVENVTLETDGSTVSQSGALDGSHSESISLSTGSNKPVNVTYVGDGSRLNYSVAWADQFVAEDPMIDAGTTTIAHSGLLDEGESVSKQVAYSETSSTTIERTGGTHEVIANASWTEVSESKDPAVTVNGHSASYTGVLGAGETTSISTDPSWVVDGENTVEVSMAGANGGPAPEVGLDYQHEAGATSTSFDYSGETWSERYNISHTFVGDQTGATMKLPFDSEKVIGIKNLEVRENGGTWSSVAESDYTLNGTELTVEFGDVVDGDSVEVRATGSKVKTYDATMNVLEPTVEGDSLNTKVEFTQVDADLVGIDVSGSQANGEIHYVSESSFDSETYAEAMSNGDQILRAPGVGAGSTMTVSTVPMDVTPESGAMEVVLEDPNPDRPRFILREGGTVGASNVEVEYTNTLSGERYVLWSETEGREVDADRAESPVYFVTDGSTETYSIFQKDASTGGGGGSGGGVVPVESSGLSSLIVVPVVAISIGGLWLLGRRFGGDSARGVRGNAALLVGGTIIAIVAAELVTPRSLTSDITFALGDALASGAGAVILGLAVLVGLWAINQRTSATIPNWLLGVAGFLVVVMSAEAIRPGSLLGVISGAIAEVGAAVVLIGLIAVAAIMYRRASTPSNKIVFDSGDE